MKQNAKKQMNNKQQQQQKTAVLSGLEHVQTKVKTSWMILQQLDIIAGTDSCV